MSATYKYYDLAAPVVKTRLNPHRKDAPPGCNFEPVGYSSPIAYRKAAERLAYCFRREFDYFFVQYEAKEANFSGFKVMHDRVLMFGKLDQSTSEPNTRTLFFGAVCVRWMEWSNAPACWTLDWAWFHPYERRKGHMTKAWPYIVQMFPDLWVSHPRSAAMEAFLVKVGFIDPSEAVIDFVI
jgi:hypothetical protein